MERLESRPSFAERKRSKDNALITVIGAVAWLSAIVFFGSDRFHPALPIDTGKFSNQEPPVLALPPSQSELLDIIAIRDMKGKGSKLLPNNKIQQ